MEKNRIPGILYIALVLCVVAGCECKKCEDVKPALIGEYDFVSVDNTASGYGHCTYDHTIGIAEGGNPCQVAVIGLDGWGSTTPYSVVSADVVANTDNPGFKILSGQVINSQNTNGCSDWSYLNVRGEGQRNANLLQVKVIFDDPGNNYNSGQMELTYRAR